MSVSANEEKTFRVYNSSQAQAYILGRGVNGTYPPALYSTILLHHGNSGGQFDCLLDVGCGPGNATRDISLNFSHAVGADGSSGMIEAARKEGGDARDSPILFEVADAENCDRINGLGSHSVDLLTAAMAAHWFDMTRFWKAAAKIVRPNGTVALWTIASLYCHPEFPNAQEIQRVLFKLERETLAPFANKGIKLTQGGYTELQLPWDVQPPIEEFDHSTLVRYDWNRDGHVPPGEQFFNEGSGLTVDELEQGLNTASMVTRWREANPTLIGTEDDCVKSVVNELRRYVANGAKMKLGGWTVLLMVKKK